MCCLFICLIHFFFVFNAWKTLHEVHTVKTRYCVHTQGFVFVNYVKTLKCVYILQFNITDIHQTVFHCILSIVVYQL